METYKNSQSTPKNRSQNRSQKTIIKPDKTPYYKTQNRSQKSHIETQLYNQSDKLKFTDLTIKHLKSPSKRTLFWSIGANRFGIRVSPKGTKSWVLMYEFKGKSRMMTLGRYPKMSLSEARKAYAENLFNVKLGIDPAKEKVSQNEQLNQSPTVGELIEKYIDYCVVKKEVSWKEKKRALTKELVSIKDEKAVNITFRDIAKIINKVYVIRQKPTQAKRLLSHIKCMFRYAKNFLGIVEINPCSDLEVPKAPSSPKRNLSAKEIYLFWNNMDYTLMTPVVRLGLKFMLCTLARGIEVRKMKWCDVNLEEKTWFIPSENAKNGRQILLPLNAFALNILLEIKEYTSQSEFVFGHHVTMNYGELKREYSLSVMAKDAFSHAMRDNFELLNIEDKFTPHDLRRTSATCLTTVGYPREWVGKLLNHMPNNITSKIYDVFDYFEEKRAGMEALQYILYRILSTKSVELVPSLHALRKEFLSKKLIYHFLDEGHYGSRQNKQMGFLANSLNPVTDTLFYAHDDLTKLN